MNNLWIPVNVADFVNEIKGLGLNGDNVYVERQKHTLTNAQDNASRNLTQNKNNHYNIYTIYPLIDYIIDLIDVFGIISRRYYRRELAKCQATRGYRK